MSNHSPTPWTIARDEHHSGASNIWTAGMVVCRVMTGLGEGNANSARIVACVNACEGFDDNDLADLTAHHKQYKAERDALRAALQAIADGKMMVGIHTHLETVETYQRHARAALARSAS